MKKDFRIGERAVGGIIRIELNKDEMEVTAVPLDWETKEPVRFQEPTDDRYFLYNTLLDWTDSYHTDMIMEWLAQNGWQ